MSEQASYGFEFHLNDDDPDLVPIPLRLPEGTVFQIDAALEHFGEQSPIHTRGEFAEYAIMYALKSLSDDAAAIWMGGDDPAAPSADILA